MGGTVCLCHGSNEGHAAVGPEPSLRNRNVEGSENHSVKWRPKMAAISSILGVLIGVGGPTLVLTP